MSPSSSGPLLSSQHSNPIFGFKVKDWPHNIDPPYETGVVCIAPIIPKHANLCTLLSPFLALAV